jgi:TolA-binding protein
MRSHGSRPAVVLAALVLVSAAVGCAPQLDRIEVSVQENHDEMADLKAENRRLLREMEALGQLLRMDRDAGDESSAMRLAKLSQVSARLDQLLQKLDDNAEYMRDLSARVDLLATRSGVPMPGREYRPPTPATGGVELPEEGRTILEVAELDRSQGNIALARSGFEEFLERYPGSEAGDRALYWLGDLAYGDEDHAGAMAWFQRLLDEYPASAYVPAALYKGRSSLLALGRSEEAWELGGRLLEQHSDSPEAALLSNEMAGE